MGDSSAGLLFQRVVHPSIDPWVHANRLGITLKSAPANENVRKRTKSPHSMPGRKLSARSPLSFRAKSSTVRFTPKQHSEVQYVQNIVVPIHAPTDDLNVLQSSHQFAFSAPRIRTALPKMHPPASARASAPNFSSSHHDNGLPHHYAHSLPGDSVSCKDSDTSSRWNTSDQALRYDNEQDIRSRSRLLKRASQVRPHRVDRMYYISGSLMGMQPRYHVDQEEFQRLQELAQERRAARHYGRGIRTGSNVRFGLDSAQSDVRVPRQPPPSSMGDADMSLDALNVAAMNVIDPRSVKSSITADHASQAAAAEASASEATSLPAEKQIESVKEEESVSVNGNDASHAECDAQQEEEASDDKEVTASEAADTEAIVLSGEGLVDTEEPEEVEIGGHSETEDGTPKCDSHNSVSQEEYDARSEHGVLNGDNAEQSVEQRGLDSGVTDADDIRGSEDPESGITGEDVRLENGLAEEEAGGSDEMAPITEEESPVINTTEAEGATPDESGVMLTEGQDVVGSGEDPTNTAADVASENTPESEANSDISGTNPGRGPVVFENILIEEAPEAENTPS